MDEDRLYARGAATLLASWEAYAAGRSDASVQRLGGVSAAVFPSGAERSVYNNALLDRGLGSDARAQAVDAMASAYLVGGIDRYAAWVHERDVAMREELAAREYVLAESTRTMGRWIEDAPLAVADVGVVVLSWDEYLDYLGMTGLPGLLANISDGSFHALGVYGDGELVATAIAFDHEGDCGIYNMSTIERVRRRGLATALTARHLNDAAERGCTTASLQSTPIADGVYAAEGFRDLGRFFEFVPASGS